MSNIKNYKYDWIWDKMQGGNFLNAKKQPLRKYENIAVFYRTQPNYQPQLVDKEPNKVRSVGKRLRKTASRIACT